MADGKMKTILTLALIGFMKLYLWTLLAPLSLINFFFDEQLDISI